MIGQPTTEAILACVSCGYDFVFSAGEQELLKLRGVSLVPERCSRCARRRNPVGVTPSDAADLSSWTHWTTRSLNSRQRIASRSEP
jgi:recombinational DNA repair protein (RecF pathway)